MFLVHDFETTGLLLHPDAELRKQPKPTEWGGALLSLETGEVIDTINILINPEEEITAEITKITGITNEMLRDAPTFKQALPRIVEFVSRSTVWCAHNLPFDSTIMRLALRRIGEEENFPFPLRGICTVGLYRDVYGKNPRMVELYEDIMGIPLHQSHRALDDVMNLVQIIQKEEIWRL